MSRIKVKNKNGEWVELSTEAINTRIMDVEGNFESDNVEGALRELAEKQPDFTLDPAVELQIKKNTLEINNVKKEISNVKGNVESTVNTLNDHEDRISYLEANGGGGGGSIVPTITSTFKDCAIEKGQDFTIPIFFSSPSGGTGTAYVIVNNMEVDYLSVKQGNNNLKILGKHLTQTDNIVGIYVKDRAGLVSNQLNWNVIAGGIEVTTTFDYEVDYGITDEIIMPYNIETGIDGEITLHLTIDGTTYDIPSKKGYNQITISEYVNSLGTHSVSMYATVDKYTSQPLSFNLIITSTTELYLSTTFVNGSKFTFGTPISINYRLSKKSTELFDVSIYVDDKLEKTQELTVGSYYWTYTKASVGEHTIMIRVVSKDGSEDKSLTITLEVEKGIYIPVEDITEDLQLDLNAAGKSNNDNHNGFWKDSSGNRRDAEMINFNFSTNGFINGHVVCDNNAYIKIPYSPWADNAKRGSTIDLIYTPINSGNEDARVIDYTYITDEMAEGEIKPFKGLFADIRQAIVSSSNSGASSGKVSLDENSGEIHLTWVLDRANKFCKTYINGILSRIMFLSDSGSGNSAIFEDFSHNEFIYLNSTKGENCGTYDIKRLRIWGHALTSDEVLRTHIAAIDDLERQEEVYNFNYNNTTLPRMDLFGDITNMTPYQTVDMRIQYTSPNEEKYGASFNTGIQNNPVKIQGTSSLQYVRHNYTIYLKDEFGSPMMYNPYGEANAMPDSVFCLKADYIESSHGNNTGMANFINDNVYDTKLPPQLENPAMRTTIAGFPIVLYMNGEYLGVYNFNHDRYSTESYGYDYKKYPNMLVYEINSNSNTSAGAFYRYGDNVESSANINERDYYARDFKLIYGNRTGDSDTYSEIKSLVEWVSVAEQDLFRETISEHFNKEYLFRYLLTVLMIGGVDSLGKNMKITTFDGRVWYPTFYDLDTCLGIDNSGYLTIEPDVEIEEGSFNTSNSNLWTKVMNFFASELKEEWALMRQGRFTLDNLLKYVVQNQIEVIPAKYYNDDAQIKYLDFGSLYTYCCHGSKELLVKRWLRERIAYVDSKMGYFTSQDDQVTIRMNKTGYVEFDITSYIPLYFSVKWSNADGGTQTFKVKRGQKQTFNYTSTTATDQEVIIYHAQYIKEINNISNLRPSSCILANATKLNNVEIHSDKLYNVNFTNNRFLRNLDLEGCTALGTVTATGSVLDVSNCNYLTKLNIYKTALTGVLLNTSGGSLKEIYYPTTIQEVQLIKQTLLEKVGLPYGNNGSEIPTSLYNVDIEECPNIRTLNTSEDSSINTKWVSMKYCQNLVIRNSLNYETISLEGFQRLKTIKLENMFNLKSLGFDNMLPKGENSTLQYMGVSYCPNLTNITMNCTSNDYEVTFADGALLDLSGANTLNSLSSNCIIHGLETIVLPLSVKHLFFTNEYGEGFSSIKNIWSTRCCEINKEGLLPVPIRYNNPDYIGIDFEGMSLNDIDLGALVNIPDAINFNISPTSVNPNFNINRDGVEYPYLQPTGTLDLSNYTESLARFFNGVDLNKLTLIVNNPLPQEDLSYCFYGCSFNNTSQIEPILNNISTVSNMEYCFYKTTIDSTEILNRINMKNGTSLAYCFGYCKNITELNDVSISSKVSSVEGMFEGSNIARVNNFTVLCSMIDNLFKNCKKLLVVNNFSATATTSYKSLFEGCSSLVEIPLKDIPTYITDISYMYKDCTNLQSANGMVFGENLVSYEGIFEGCENLIQANNMVVKGNYYNTIFRNWKGVRYINNLLISFVGRSMNFSNMFEGCSDLMEFSFHNDSYVKEVISMDYMFKGTNISSIDITNVNLEKLISAKYLFTESNMTSITFKLPTTISSIQGLLSNCPNLEEIHDVAFEKHLSNCTDWITGSPIKVLRNCTVESDIIPFQNITTLTTIDNMTWKYRNIGGKFYGCTGLETVTINITDQVTTAFIDGKGTFENCTSLREIDFTESDLSNLRQFDRMFYGDSSLTTIKNFKVTNPNATCGNEVLTECPINNTDGLYIGSQSSLDMFKLGEGSKITNFTDFEIATNVKDLSHLFENYQLITKDMKIPSHVTNVEKMYYNCFRLESIVSNWNTSYDIGDINSTDCYAGCTNLKYIDGDLYQNEFGEYTVIYSIPLEWGGSLSFDDYENGFEVLSKYMNDNTITFEGEIGDYVTDWGDGTVNRNTSHTYAKEGRYIIRTENPNPFGLGKGVAPDQDKVHCVTKIYKLNTSILTNGNYLFAGFDNLYQCCDLTFNLTNGSHMFDGCVKMPNPNTENWHFSGTDLSYMFNNCSSLTSVTLNIPDNITDISYIYKGCSMLTDISGSVFGEGITNIISWIPSNLTTANNITVKTNQKLFKGHTKIKHIEGLTLGDSVTDVSSWFEGCTELSEDFDILSHIVNCTNTFKGCVNMTHVHSNWKKTYNGQIITTDCYAGCNRITHIDGENILAYEGDSGIGLIPEDWGGYGFTRDVTGMYEMVIPEDNYTLKFSQYGTGVTWNFTSDQSINWGDGNITIGERTHTYSKAGTYVVKGKVCTGGNGYGPDPTIQKCLSKVYQLPLNKATANTGLQYTFRGCTNLTSVTMKNLKPKSMINTMAACPNLQYVDLSGIDSTQCYSYQDLFNGCSNLTTIEGFKISSEVATNTISTFNGCQSITELDITDWNFSNITNANHMFNGCIALERLIGIETIDLSKLQTAQSMFFNCKKLQSLEGVRITSTTTTINSIIGNCISLESYDFIKLWDTKNVNDFTNAFTNLPLTEDFYLALNYSKAQKIGGLFQGNSAITNLSFLNDTNIVPEQLTSINLLCANCENLTDVSTLNWNLPKVTDIGEIFKECKSLTNIDLSNMNAPNATSWSGICYGCSKLISLKFPNVGNRMKRIDRATQGCYSLKSIGNLDLNILDTAEGWVYLSPYDGVNSYKNIITIEWVNNLKGDNRVKFFDMLTYVGNTSYGFYRKVSVESIEDLVLNHLEDCVSNPVNLKIPKATLEAMSERAIASATSKGWTLVAG